MKKKIPITIGGIMAFTCHVFAGCNLPNYVQSKWVWVGGTSVNCPQVILTKINAMALKIPNLSLEFAELQGTYQVGTKTCCKGTTTGIQTANKGTMKLTTEQLNVFLYGVSFKKQFQTTIPLKGPTWIKFDAGAGATLESKFILDATGGRVESECEDEDWIFGSASGTIDAGVSVSAWLQLAYEKRLGNWKEIIDVSGKAGKAGKAGKGGVKATSSLKYNSVDEASGWDGSASITEVYGECGLNLFVVDVDVHVVFYSQDKPGLSGSIKCNGGEWSLSGDEISFTGEV